MKRHKISSSYSVNLWFKSKFERHKPAAKMAKIGAPVNEFWYCSEDKKICHSLLAKVKNSPKRIGRSSVRDNKAMLIMLVAMTTLAQSTSRSSNTLISGVAEPVSSLKYFLG